MTSTQASLGTYVSPASGTSKLPLERVKSGTNEFALTLDGIVYSLAYAVKDGRLEVVAGIQNKSGKVFAPQRALVNFGVDTEMVKFPDWNERFFPTLLRCEKTHFWGYFMRPDGMILGVASPDPVVSWANGYNDGGHRMFTSCLDFINTAPQPARHPNVPQTLAPGESRQWRVFLVPLDKLTEVQPTLAKVAGIPMITLDRPTVEEGQPVDGIVTSPAAVNRFPSPGRMARRSPSESRDGTVFFRAGPARCLYNYGHNPGRKGDRSHGGPPDAVVVVCETGARQRRRQTAKGLHAHRKLVRPLLRLHRAPVFP